MSEVRYEDMSEVRYEDMSEYWTSGLPGLGPVLDLGLPGLGPVLVDRERILGPTRTTSSSIIFSPMGYSRGLPLVNVLDM